ncbi:hypothetical protein [Sphingomonas sp.]|uniref:hypothetical protein n=1 Tax=Sphingomonas sp. TaxID=28214 RepID=UPI002FD91852
MDLRKDRSLDELARFGNVAQFVSFSPDSGGLAQTYSRVAGYPANHVFADLSAAVEALLGAAADGTVNVRSYTPDSPRSREFVYGLADVEAVLATVARLSAEGLHLIINETVDIQDGGVSGVVQDGVMEFAPDDTPRCVEKPGVASLPRDWGAKLLQSIYGFAPELPLDGRTEFSIHPKPRGWRLTHTLLWEHEGTFAETATATLAWPNRFSNHIGDKAYGLLMADLAGLPVPRTEVIARRVAPFQFGRPTGSNEVWIRTSPRVQEPGLFTTHKGWIDPFKLLAEEDPTGDRIASILRQDAVPAAHSGAAIVDGDGDFVVEGISGEGDLFMLGHRKPERLPGDVVEAVEAMHYRARKIFGPVRFEWVYDGRKVWIVQFHVGATNSTQRMLVPGERDHWVVFHVSEGLEALRNRLNDIDPTSGLVLLGDVGMTSHIADLVRKAGVPSRVMPLGSPS